MSRPPEDNAPMKSSRSATNNAAGPLDAVKLELAIVLGLVLGVVIVIFRIEMPDWVELALLALAGFGAGGWLAWRTRAVVARQDWDAKQPGEGDESDQTGRVDRVERERS